MKYYEMTQRSSLKKCKRTELQSASIFLKECGMCFRCRRLKEPMKQWIKMQNLFMRSADKDMDNHPCSICITQRQSDRMIKSKI